MEFVCCNIKYSTTDPKTFEYIHRYKILKPTKLFINNIKVTSEIVYVLDCIKSKRESPCKKIKIFRYGKIDNKKFEIEHKELSGKAARRYLDKVQNLMIEMPQLSPYHPCPIHTKYIPMVFYKHIKTIEENNKISDTIRPAYINGAGFAGKEINCPVKIIK